MFKIFIVLAALVTGAQTYAASTTSAEMMNKAKYKACMFNDLLSDAVFGNDQFNTMRDLLARSNCESLPRSVETWNRPPNFPLIASRIASIKSRTGKDYDYGMFIAETIKTTAVYSDDSGVAFNFAAMCKPGSQGFWGADTCVPLLSNAEFQRYVRFIVGKAIDLGIRDIMFGQTGHTDPNQVLPQLVAQIRSIAANKGKFIIVGQQTNGIPPESYIRSTDYIVGPVNVDLDISQACIPGIPGCQAVVFHPEVRGKANNVIAEFDWSSLEDDIHRYARKSLSAREAYVSQKVQELTAIGVGFVFPFRILLNGGSPNGNCYGLNQYVYTPHSNLGCKDEDFLNRFLAGNFGSPSSGSCTLDGRTVANGSSYGFYSSRTSSNCANIRQTRTCTNGVLSGSSIYAYSSCSASTPAPTIPLFSILLPSQTRSMTNTQYISALFRAVLGRDVPASDSGHVFWVNQLNGGRARESARIEFVYSSEFSTKFPTNNRDWVKQVYRSLLRREADAGGLDYYANRLTSGTITRTGVIQTIHQSSEYRSVAKD